MGIVEEEADESIYWMKLLVASGQVRKEEDVADLRDEANQLVAIAVSSIKAARRNRLWRNIPYSIHRIPHSAFRIHQSGRLQKRQILASAFMVSAQ